MRIKLSIIVILAVMCSMFGCTSKEIYNSMESSTSSLLSSLSQEYTVDKDGYVWNYFSTLDELYQKGKNYEIYSDKVKTGFHYYVKDNDGNVIDEGYHDWRGSFGFNEKDGILELDYGFGGPLWQRRYYDLSNGRVSRFFSKPLQTSGELVAYFKTKGENQDIILVVQNMFDSSKYYKEFERDFSTAVITGQSTAEFINDNKQLKINYWINPNDKEVTETIDLN